MPVPSFTKLTEVPVPSSMMPENVVLELSPPAVIVEVVATLLVTVPVPSEFEIDRGELEAILADALELANERGIRGKEVTPFLLSQMSERSGGRTLAANIALLENNARVAAGIAAAF